MDRYVTMFPGWSEEDDPMVAISNYPEPNKTIHKSYEYFTYDAEEIQDPMEYILNENGTVASVTTRATMVKIKHEYDIVIGDEFSTPNSQIWDTRVKYATVRIPSSIEVPTQLLIRLPTANFLYN